MGPRATKFLLKCILGRGVSRPHLLLTKAGVTPSFPLLVVPNSSSW